MTLAVVAIGSALASVALLVAAQWAGRRERLLRRALALIERADAWLLVERVSYTMSEADAEAPVKSATASSMSVIGPHEEARVGVSDH